MSPGPLYQSVAKGQGHRFTGDAGPIASRAPSGGGEKGQALQGEAAFGMGHPMTEIRDPSDCMTMTEVRSGVDDVDRQVVALLIQ